MGKDIFTDGSISYSNKCDKKLLDSDKPCLYCISHNRTDSNDKNDMLTKLGWTDDKTNKKTDRVCKSRIAENIHDMTKAGFSLSKLGFRIEFIIELSGDWAWLYDKFKNGEIEIPDRYIQKIIMINELDCKPVMNDSSKVNGNTEYFEKVDVDKLYKFLTYYLDNKKIDREAINELIALDLYPLQMREANKCVRAFLKKNKRRYLLNACCRCGKTYIAFGIMNMMYKHKKRYMENAILKVLVYSFKTEVSPEWAKRATKCGYYIVSSLNKTSMEEQYKEAIRLGSKKIIVIVSVADLYGEDANGHVKPKNRWIHKELWDMAIGDEYHYGIHNANASTTFVTNNEEFDPIERKAMEKFSRNELPITADYMLFLTATGYFSFERGDFIDGEDGSLVTYSDMKKEKEYYSIPDLKLLTISYTEDIIREYIERTNANQFSFSNLFKADYVDGQWIFRENSMVYNYMSSIFAARFNNGKTLFSSNLGVKYVKCLDHIIIVMDEIYSCYALKAMLERFAHIARKYYIHVVAGNVNSLKEKDCIVNEMERIDRGDDVEKTGTITITCGKLLTGVSVPYWSSIFLFTDRSGAEFMHQTAGRLYTPRVDEKDETKVLKDVVLIVDPDPNRALFFRMTFDSMEKMKNKGLTEREIYIETSKFIDFGDMIEPGVVTEIPYEKMFEYGPFIGRKNQTEHIAFQELVTFSADKIKTFLANNPEINEAKLHRLSNAIYRVNEVTSNSLIDKTHNTVVTNKNDTPRREIEKLDIKREHIVNLGTNCLASFCWVTFANKITCYDDIKKLPDDFVKRYFKIGNVQIGTEIFDEMFEMEIMHKSVFEKLINMYNAQYEVIRKSLAKCA